MEDPAVSAPPEGHTAQASAEVSEEVELTTLSSAVEVPAEVAPPEALVAALAPAVPVVSLTLAREEPFLSQGEGCKPALLAQEPG